MPSKLDPLKDQIVEWVRHGKTSREIASKAAERGIIISHVSVAAYVKKLMPPETFVKLNTIAKNKMANLDEALAKAIDSFEQMEAIPPEEWTSGHRDKYKVVGEWFDRIARLRGLYAPQVAVQINIDARRRLWEILQGEEKS